VGGSIHRAATSDNAANDHRIAAEIKNHRINDQKRFFRSGVLVLVLDGVFTFQDKGCAAHNSM
jgi:hypothetical protein